MINCKYCGCVPAITDDHGIGDVFCPNCCPPAVCERTHEDQRFHFSGKFNVSKKMAIRMWNAHQGKGYQEREIT